MGTKKQEIEKVTILKSDYERLLESERKNNDSREKFWCEVYIGYVSAANSTKDDGAFTWANRALERFDEKFNK